MTLLKEITAGLNLNPICYIKGHQEHGTGKFCNRKFCWNNWKGIKPFNYFRSQS